MKKSLRIFLLCVISVFSLNINASAADANMYLIGSIASIDGKTITNSHWESDGTQIYETSIGSGIFMADVTVTGTDDGYFIFSPVNSDWGSINSYRWGPYGDSDVELNETYQYAYGLTQGGGKAFKLDAGTYKLSINTNVTPHTMTYIRNDAQLYVLGAITASEYIWNPGACQPLSIDADGKYSTVLRIANGQYDAGGNASFCLTSKTGTWDEVNPHRFGPTTDGNTPSYTGANALNYNSGTAWSVKDGVYKIEVDPINGTFNMIQMYIPTSLEFAPTFTTEDGYISKIELKAETEYEYKNEDYTYTFSVENFPFSASGTTSYTLTSNTLTNDVDKISIVSETTCPVKVSITSTDLEKVYEGYVHNVTFSTDYNVDVVETPTVRLTENDKNYRIAFINFNKPTFDDFDQVLPATKYDIYRVIDDDETLVGTVPYNFDFDNKPTYDYEGGQDSYVYQHILTDSPESVTYVVKAVYASAVEDMEKSAPTAQFESTGISTGIDGIATDVCGIYPNPTSGIIHISATEEIKSISVYDLTGALVKQLPAASTADLSDLAPSTYLVKVNAMTPVLVIVK